MIEFGDERLPERFWDKVSPEPNTGCWLWVACINPCGYGNFRDEVFGTLAHRISYSRLVGPIPRGLQIDHLCRVRSCCNPEHLEPVTQEENMRRGEAGDSHNAEKTHCPKGHPYSGENTYFTKQGHRVCRKCRCLCERARRERKKGR